MDGGVADTGPQRGSAGSGVVAESAADSVVARSCVRVRLFNLFVVVAGWEPQDSVCLCVIRVPVCPVCPVAVCVQAHRRWLCSVWV